MKSLVQISFVAFYVLMSQFILPSVIRGENLLIFSTWRLFTNVQSHRLWDITWTEKDGAKKYLLRKGPNSYDSKASTQRFELFHGLQADDRVEFVETRRSKIHLLCKCDEFQLVKINSSLSEHVFQEHYPNLVSEFKI